VFADRCACAIVPGEAACWNRFGYRLPLRVDSLDTGRKAWRVIFAAHGPQDQVVWRVELHANAKRLIAFATEQHRSGRREVRISIPIKIRSCPLVPQAIEYVQQSIQVSLNLRDNI